MSSRLPADPVTAYAKQIANGRRPAGRLQKLACKRHLEDLKKYRGARAPFKWDLAFALKKLSFFPELRHWRGELKGQPFELMDWQAFCTGSLYGWCRRDDDEVFRYTRAYISVPKKSGKSVWVGALGLLKAFYDDEQGAEVYSIAMSKEQADIVWNEAANLVLQSKNPLLRRLDVSSTKPNVKHNIHDRETVSKFEPLSSDKDSGDGKNPNCLIADEVHRYKDADLLNMLEESMATRRNQLTIEITTAGWDRKSICYQHDEYSRSVLEGRVEDPTWFAFICRADKKKTQNWSDEDVWTNPQVWAAANPSYGVSIREERVRAAVSSVREIPSKLNDFLRYRLNVWTEQAERWVELDRWIESGNDTPALEEFRGRRAFAGLDLASLRDLCALAVVVPDEELDRFFAYFWYWVPENNVGLRVKRDRVPYDRWIRHNLIKTTPGDTADHRVIRDDIVQIAEFFDIVQLAYDPHNSGNLPHELDDELGPYERMNPETNKVELVPRVVKTYQGAKSMAGPVKELERVYLEARLKHGNNAVTNWMAGNVAVKTNQYDEKTIDRLRSTEKVDGMVALAMALGAFMRFGNVPEGESVYDREDRGLHVIG